jgi:hypothetical protein
MYRVYLNFSVWVVCEYIITCSFQKKFLNLWLVCLLKSHLSTYVILFWPWWFHVSMFFVDEIVKDVDGAVVCGGWWR